MLLNSQRFIVSAAAAVGMVAVIYGRRVEPQTVVMGDVEPGGGLIDLPPIHGRHLQAMVKVGAGFSVVPASKCSHHPFFASVSLG